jgi:hypothetical protein
MASAEHKAHQDALSFKYSLLRPNLDERGRRLWAAAEALSFGYGGIKLVSGATGLCYRVIAAGIVELQSETLPEPGRIRRSGGGRKPLEETDPTLVADLESLVDPVSRGDPESPMRWTSKSLSKLSSALGDLGHSVSAPKVAGLLRSLGYSLQANRKRREGNQHPDRDAQFGYVNEQTRSMQAQGQPVISVDCKKKELVGDFKNAGVEWQPQGEPEEVRVHDFIDKDLGKAIPYGVYDITKNEAWVSVGCDHDTAEFATATILRWWEQMGKPLYPDATDLMICADGGGSNSSRSRLWKATLQELANKTNLRLHVCHFPPGTSKWNKIEHRLFSHITMNWRGRPLVSYEVIVNLIAGTTTRKGLQVQAELDENPYPTKIKVSDSEMDNLNINRHEFHGEWNYTIEPQIN